MNINCLLTVHILQQIVSANSFGKFSPKNSWHHVWWSPFANNKDMREDMPQNTVFWGVFAGFRHILRLNLTDNLVLRHIFPNIPVVYEWISLIVVLLVSWFYLLKTVILGNIYVKGMVCMLLPFKDFKRLLFFYK